MTPNPNPWVLSEFGELDNYGGDYKPERTRPNNLEVLADGDHDFEILSAAMGRAKADGTGGLVARVQLKTTTGIPVEWMVWLNNPEAVNETCAELAALGFPADQWGPRFNRPLSVEIPKAIGQLKGMKFRGHKQSYAKKDKPGELGHKLRVLCGIDGRPMSPIQQAPARAPASNGPASQPLPPAAGPQDDDSIPF